MRSRDLPVTASWRWASPPGAAFELHDDHVVWDAPDGRVSWFAHRLELDRPPEDPEPWFTCWDRHHAGKGIGRAVLAWETPLDVPFGPIPERYAPARMLGLVREGPPPPLPAAALPIRAVDAAARPAVIAAAAAQAPGYGPEHVHYVRWLYDGLAARGARTLAAYDGERPVAAATVVPGPDGARFQDVWTDRAWRRQGLATAIVARLLAAGGRFVLQADEDGEALRIYLRLGFRPVSRVVEISRANA